MSFQVPITINEAVSRIRERRLLLPAIQREFVWEAWQVEWLFDSLLQGYPIGSFLLWEVREPRAKMEYRYYEFLREFRERYATHNPEFNASGHYDFDAVLDGQQRLTALYIGLAGTYAYKSPRVWWENTERALPTRRLHLNIMGPAEDIVEEESGRVYEFKFLSSAEYSAKPDTWFPVPEILAARDMFAFTQMLKLRGYSDKEFATKTLSELHAAVHTSQLINYYSVRGADLDRALNVFVRVNSGGVKLSLSDMLMSTAIANWRKKDAKRVILGLVDQVQALGFFIDKDLVLKACLYLYSGDIRYKVTNFSAAHVKPFEDNWDAIAETIVAVFELVRDFGFSDKALTSRNALLPIIYWVHHTGLAKGLTTSVKLRAERQRIASWLHTMLLKSVFGSSADTILAAIGGTFFDGEFGMPYVRDGMCEFPVAAVAQALRAHAKDPIVTDEFIDSLLDTRYEDKLAFSVLALLSPGLDYRNGDFHRDHLHPGSVFSRRLLAKAGVPESEMEFCLDEAHWNSILNLAHLDGNENKSKQDKPLVAWVDAECDRQSIGREKFCGDRDLPRDPKLSELVNFRAFVGERRKLLRRRLTLALSGS